MLVDLFEWDYRKRKENFIMTETDLYSSGLYFTDFMFLSTRLLLWGVFITSRKFEFIIKYFLRE